MSSLGAGRPAPRSDLSALALAGFAVAGAVLVVSAYVLRAWALVSYPWDWSPDEGLHLDYARRALEAPGTLYPREVVPFPSVYGPLLPFLMIPLVRLAEPLTAARVAALGWTLLGTAALALILRRRAGAAWAAAGVGLYLAPFDFSYWHMLVRVDGPMLTLFLWAVAVLLPRSLERDGDRLTGPRLAAGTLLLLASILIKPTAVLHGAPLVLGWFLVHPRSALRLSAALAATGLLALGTLQALTGGGFLFVNRLWGLHPRSPGHTTRILAHYLFLTWPVLVLALAAAVACPRRWREPGLLLLAGGVTVLPMLGKHGAWWNYLLPLYAAMIVCAAGWLAASPDLLRWTRLRPATARLTPPAVGALLAIALAATRTFPLPTPRDEATARAFYGFTQELHRHVGGPFLVSRPDLVYFLAGQMEEIEGSSFFHLAAAGAPGSERVLSRVREGRYSLVIETWPVSEAPAWREALRARYRQVGGCQLGWFFGSRMMSHIFLRRDLPLGFRPPAGARCVALPPDPDHSRGRADLSSE